MSPVTVASVPCNGCRQCCIGDIIRLLPADDPTQYRTMPHPFFSGHLALERDAEGNCVYLTPTGCGIHGRAPQMCREMDCRNLARGMTFTQARKYHPAVVLIWRRGRELLRAEP